jgi:acetylornithine deacetylase
MNENEKETKHSLDLDAAYYYAVDLLKTLIGIPSVSRDESAAADALEQYMSRQSGQRVFRKNNNCWLIAPGFDFERPTLLLNSHIDTVKPVASWTREPFKATEDDDERIYGLGSNDDGASLVSLLHTYLLLKDTPQAYNLIFLASAEEEVSGRNGIESVLPELPRIDLAVVGEPTGMNAAIAEKGLVVLDGVALGKSGHAAHQEGINAIYEALPAIECLRNYRFARESEFLGPVKISVTQIQAGTAHNVVPDRCSFVVDVRTTDAYSNQEVVAALQAAVAPVTLTPRSTRLQPSGINREHPLIRRIECMGRSCFGSPTLSDQALLSCPSVKIGPGDSARSHTADEYIYLHEIREAIALYVSLLNGLKF